MPFFCLGDLILNRVSTLLGAAICVSLLAPIDTTHDTVTNTEILEDASVRIHVERVLSYTTHSSLTLNYKSTEVVTYNIQAYCKGSLVIVSHDLGSDTLNVCTPNTSVILSTLNSKLTLKSKSHTSLIRLTELFKV